MSHTEFCTVSALENNTPLIGTASADTAIWFLLEVPRPWAAKALIENDLPECVNTTLTRWVESTPKSRAVFIKKDNRPVVSPVLYIAVTEDDDQRIHQFNLQADYADIANIPLDAILTGQTDSARVSVIDVTEDPLYLVCTNGKRDNCCSKFGLPIIQAFKNEGAKHVWQCTHLGGHKFAAVVGVYPAGLYYQLFNPAIVPTFKHAIEQKMVPLQGLRGRTAYSGAAQAAEYFLRKQSGNLEIGAYKYLSAENNGNDWQVTFQNGVAQHLIKLKQTLSEPAISGCNGKLKPTPLYELISIS